MALGSHDSKPNLSAKLPGTSDLRPTDTKRGSWVISISATGSTGDINISTVNMGSHGKSGYEGRIWKIHEIRWITCQAKWPSGVLKNWLWTEVVSLKNRLPINHPKHPSALKRASQFNSSYLPHGVPPKKWIHYDSTFNSDLVPSGWFICSALGSCSHLLGLGARGRCSRVVCEEALEGVGCASRTSGFGTKRRPKKCENDEFTGSPLPEQLWKLSYVVQKCQSGSVFPVSKHPGLQGAFPFDLIHALG